jgi:hypothetical protein
MRTIVHYWPELPMAHGPFRYGTAAPSDLRVVCVWSVLGLALTYLFLVLGFGAENGPALAAAG